MWPRSFAGSSWSPSPPLVERWQWGLSGAHWSVSPFPDASWAPSCPSLAGTLLLVLCFSPWHQLCSPLSLPGVCVSASPGSEGHRWPYSQSLSSWGPFMLLQPDVPSVPLPTLLGDSSFLLLFLQTSSSVPSGLHVILTPISLRKPSCQRAHTEASTPAAQSSSAPTP